MSFKIDKDGVMFDAANWGYMFPTWDDDGNLKIVVSGKPPTESQRAAIQEFNSEFSECSARVQQVVSAGLEALKSRAIFESVIDVRAPAKAKEIVYTPFDPYDPDNPDEPIHPTIARAPVFKRPYVHS